MALWRSKGARKDAVRGTAPIEVRKSDALLFSGPGVLPGSASPLVTGTAGWAYQVGAAGFVTSRGSSDGVHLFGNDGAVTVGATGAGSTVPVAPGAGLSRVDVIWVRHPAAGENADTTSEPVFGVASGTAASSPVAPTIPTGALELARNTMTSAATSTNSTGNSITQSAPTTQLRGTPGRWRPLPLATGWVNAYAGAACEYRLVDDMWELRGAAFYAAGVPTSAVLLTSGGLTPVPSTYDINHVLSPAGLGPVGNRFATLNPRPDGNIRVYASATGGSLLVLDGVRFRGA
jgi:hypothetical protein